MTGILLQQHNIKLFFKYLLRNMTAVHHKGNY